MRHFRIGLILGVITFLAACQNPTSAIKEDIEAFKREYPNHFYEDSVDGHPLHAVWSGDEKFPPLIFIHGSPGSWEGWAAFLRNQQLQKRFHLVAVDRPGFGGSEHGKTERLLENQARRIAAALKHNHSGQPAIVVGHSMGGPVAARLSMDFPDLVRGTVFVSSAVSPELEEEKWFQVPAQWILLKWIVPTDLTVCNEEILALKGELEKLMPRWIDFKPQVAIVHGTKDDLVPIANVDFLEAHLPREKIVNVERIEGMNHFVPWKAPASILRAIETLDTHADSKMNQSAE